MQEWVSWIIGQGNPVRRVQANFQVTVFWLCMVTAGLFEIAGFPYYIYSVAAAWIHLISDLLNVKWIGVESSIIHSPSPPRERYARTSSVCFTLSTPIDFVSCGVDNNRRAGTYSCIFCVVIVMMRFLFARLTCELFTWTWTCMGILEYNLFDATSKPKWRSIAMLLWSICWPCTLDHFAAIVFFACLRKWNAKHDNIVAQCWPGSLTAGVSARA